MAKFKSQESLPIQRVKKNKRKPSWPLRKGIVYDPEEQSVAIKRVGGHRGIESGENSHRQIRATSWLFAEIQRVISVVKFLQGQTLSASMSTRMSQESMLLHRVIWSKRERFSWVNWTWPNLTLFGKCHDIWGICKNCTLWRIRYHV